MGIAKSNPNGDLGGRFYVLSIFSAFADFIAV